MVTRCRTGLAAGSATLAGPTGGE